MDPATIKAYADALGVNPLTVVFGLVIWRLVWRAHQELIDEVRRLRVELRFICRLRGHRNGDPPAE